MSTTKKSKVQENPAKPRLNPKAKPFQPRKIQAEPETKHSIRIHDSQTAAIKAEEMTEPSTKGEKPIPSFKTRAEIGKYQLQALIQARSTTVRRNPQTEPATPEQKSKPKQGT